jgi:D-lactate dehydrogenase
MGRESVKLFNSNFKREWDRALPRKGAVETSSFSRVIAAVDASHYLLTPSAVVTPENLDEISTLFAHATRTGQKLTFRSGGTSLSGQACTQHILVDIRKNFRTIEVLENGAFVRVGPGATIRQVNTRLARFGRKLGPDPASEIACTIGGVVANNSSGMSCGITQNSYRTLKSIVAVLPSGTIIDTSDPNANEQLRNSEPALFKTLIDLHEDIANTPHLKSEILRQFSIKNTMGYGINSLVDFNTPIDIFTHLLVGSEGTLAFIAEATFETIPVLTKVSTALLIFETLQKATGSLSAIVATKPTAIELLDSASLRVVQKDPQSKGVLPDIEYINHAALLVEYQAANDSDLELLKQEANLLFVKTHTSIPIIFTSDSRQRRTLWHLRKGLYAAIAGARPSGTTALLEDIAVPVDRLSAICLELRGLFTKHGYEDAVIFGHAKDGNIHFLLKEDFENPLKVDRYRAFTEDMVEAVLREGGSLKAEHGTGRIMAPFVRRQYGAELHEMMFVIKDAFDPKGLLNPDVILTRDYDLYLRHFKTLPKVEEEVDRCVECGYCEPVCPSQDLTTTPRQRIVLSRAIASAVSTGNSKLAKELIAEQRYQVIDTCAVDGMCQTACPVFINTGDLVRKLRQESASHFAQNAWKIAGKNWRFVTEVASHVLTAATASPKILLEGPNRFARLLLGEDTVPMWSPDLPRGGSKRIASGSSSSGMPDLIYFKACLGTMFGTAAGSVSCNRIAS